MWSYLSLHKHFLNTSNFVVFTLTVLTATNREDGYVGHVTTDGGGAFGHLSADTLSVAISLGRVNGIFLVYNIDLG